MDRELDNEKKSILQLYYIFKEVFLLILREDGEVRDKIREVLDDER